MRKYYSQKTFKRITVAEPQAQGETHDNSCHLHVLFIFDIPAPFIDNEVMAELWSHGITYTQRVDDAEGLALYIKAYLSDVEYYEEDVSIIKDMDNPPKNNIVKNVNGWNKKFIKGEWLKYYPTGMSLFSASRGMKRFIVE